MFLTTIRLAGRSLLHSPGFTLLAVITLGLGIGANTAMFSVLNSILLKPLPYPESERLIRIDRATPQNPQGRISPADFLDVQRETAGYGDLGAYALGDTSLSEPGQPAEMVEAIRTTANFFSLLRVKPHLGRDFLPGEDVPGKDHIVLLSNRCWQQRFGGRSDVIGRSIRVDGEPHEIIGVLPAWFNDWRHLGGIDIFRPLAFDRASATDRRSTILRLIVRRNDKASQQYAEGFFANLGTRLARDFPEVNADSTWRVIPLNASILSRSGQTLTMLVGLSAFVLLIACSNLANLLLARTMGQAREFAVRAAIGASRMQLLRPLIAEALLLALAGGGCAILVAQWAGDWLSMRSTGDNGERVSFIIDWHVLAWAFGAALVTALAFGLAPALFALRLDVNNTLKTGGRGAAGGRGHRRFRHALIVGQFALAMILLAGAALYMRGLDEVTNSRSGWQSDRLVTGTVVLPAASYGDAEKRASFYRVTLERLRAIPGVASASISSFTPFFNWGDIRKYLVEGRQLPQAGHEPAAAVNSVSPGYFATYGTRLLSGRAFDERDTLSSPRVYIVSETTAKALFGSESAIGHRLSQTGGGAAQWGEIIGVAADVRSVIPDRGPVSLQLYQALTQDPRPYNEITVRSSGIAPSTLVHSVREVMTQLDPDLPVRQLQPADATIDRANYQSAVLRDMLTIFALLGLGLASLGIYGVIARTMAQRAGEFAIRFALGACVKDITHLVLTSGVKLAVLGAMVGLGGAIALSRFLAASNPNMHMNSPAALVGTTVLLLTVGLLASWLPARRAARINPIDSLRAE